MCSFKYTVTALATNTGNTVLSTLSVQLGSYNLGSLSSLPAGQAQTITYTYIFSSENPLNLGDRALFPLHLTATGFQGATVSGTEDLASPASAVCPEKTVAPSFDVSLSCTGGAADTTTMNTFTYTYSVIDQNFCWPKRKPKMSRIVGGLLLALLLQSCAQQAFGLQNSVWYNDGWDVESHYSWLENRDIYKEA